MARQAGGQHVQPCSRVCTALRPSAGLPAHSLPTTTTTTPTPSQCDRRGRWGRTGRRASHGRSRRARWSPAGSARSSRPCTTSPCGSGSKRWPGWGGGGGGMVGRERVGPVDLRAPMPIAVGRHTPGLQGLGHSRPVGKRLHQQLPRVHVLQGGGTGRKGWRRPSPVAVAATPSPRPETQSTSILAHLGNGHQQAVTPKLEAIQKRGQAGHVGVGTHWARAAGRRYHRGRRGGGAAAFGLGGMVALPCALPRRNPSWIRVATQVGARWPRASPSRGALCSRG